MSNDVPVLIMAFIRPDLITRAMEYLSKSAPPILYVMGDGPRNHAEAQLCEQSRKVALNPSWNCEVIPLFSDENQGLVTSFVKGMKRMFDDHEFGIFLEDDILLSESFYPFAKELLLKYREDNRIGHINASNFIPNFKSFNTEESYILSAHPHIWGFATWKRMWDSYDLDMKGWELVNKRKMLREFCFSWRERRGIKKMFDLHCNNPSPWACDYQWIFNSLYNKSLSITPKCNMSLNIGFGRSDSTHTIGQNPLSNPLMVSSFPLIHPHEIIRNFKYDRALSNKICPSDFAVFTGKLKNKLSKIFVEKK